MFILHPSILSHLYVRWIWFHLSIWCRCLLCKPYCPSVQTIKRKIQPMSSCLTQPWITPPSARNHSVCKVSPSPILPHRACARTKEGISIQQSRFSIYLLYFLSFNLLYTTLFFTTTTFIQHCIMSSSAIIAAKKRLETYLKKYEIPTVESVDSTNTEESCKRYTFLLLFLCKTRFH